MSAQELISFKRTDNLPQKFVDVALDIADHFKIRREYVPDFCAILSRSRKWNISNLSLKLEERLDRFGKVAGRKIVELTRRAYSLCETDKEIGELRGALLEALVIGAHGGSNKLAESNKSGWGARVTIHRGGISTSIRYVCTNPVDSDCRRRSTVDYGVWNGKSGRFFECKVQPAGIGCKEIKYLNELTDKLTSENISHELFFVCSESVDAIKDRLLELNIGLKFQPIGVKELQSMMN